jgi:hypothetical protein
MSQSWGGFVLPRSGMRLKNLKRVDGSMRVDASVSGPSDTPKGPCRGERVVLREQREGRSGRSPWEESGFKQSFQDRRA